MLNYKIGHNNDDNTKINTQEGNHENGKLVGNYWAFSYQMEKKKSNSVFLSELTERIPRVENE